MSTRSPSATSWPGSVSAPLLIGALSPVSAASCVSSVAEATIRPSAGTMSPASSRTTSPGTTSSAGTISYCPSRSTRVWGTCSFASASTLARALSSCRVPSTTLSRTSAATSTAVETCAMSRLATATTASMMFMGSRSWDSATTQIDGGFSLVSLFGPVSCRRRAASRWVRPLRTSAPKSATTCSGGSRYGGSASALTVRWAGTVGWAETRGSVGALIGSPSPRRAPRCGSRRRRRASGTPPTGHWDGALIASGRLRWVLLPWG